MKRLYLTFALIISMLAAYIPSVLAADEAGMGENIALGKDVSANTINGGFLPEYVVDGNLATPWANVTGIAAYITVDLGAPYLLDFVAARSRRDMNQETSRQQWTLELSNDEAFKESVVIGKKEYPGSFGSDLEVYPSLKQAYRYIRVSAPAGRHIVISEIEAYGKKYIETKDRIYSDITNQNLKNASELSEALGIEKAVYDNEYGVNLLIKRGKAADIILRAQNIDASEASFERTYDSEYSNSINAAAELGFVDANADFDEYITGAEFAGMLLKLMGYDKLKDISDKTKLLMAANEAGILKNISLSPNDYLSKGNMVIMLYNALTEPMLKYDTQSETAFTLGKKSCVLEAYFNMSLSYGVVTENSVTSFTEPQSRAKGWAVIDGISYTDINDKIKKYIGKSVMYLHGTDDKSKIYGCWLYDKKNDVVRIDTDDIENASGRIIEAKDGKRYKLSENVYVLKNGVAFSGWTEADFKPDYGYIELSDYNCDGVYELLKIMKPQVIAVSSYRSENGRLVIEGINGERLDESEYSALYIYNGELETTVDAIEANNLVLAYVSENKNSVEIHIEKKLISGTVTELSEDYVYINGESFEKSKYYKDNSAVFQPVRVGINAEFIADLNGRIYFVKDAGLKAYIEKLGIVRKAWKDDESEKAYISLFDEDGEFLEFPLSEKASIDGIKYTFENINAVLDSLTSKLVFFNVNSGGEVSVIDSETENNGGRLHKIDRKFANPTRYIPGGSGFFFETNLVLPIKLDVPSFSVPLMDGKPAMGENYKQFYKVGGFRDVYNYWNEIKDGDCFYNPDDFGRPGAVVRYRDNLLTYDGVNAVEGSKGIIITNITEEYDAESGECVYALSGLDLENGHPTSIKTVSELNKIFEGDKVYREKASWIFDDTKLIDIDKVLADTGDKSGYVKPIDSLKTGDIIKYSVDTENKVNGIERLYRHASGPYGDYTSFSGAYYSVGGNSSYGDAVFRLDCGRIDLYESTLIKLKTSKIGAGEYNSSLFDLLSFKNVIFISGKNVQKQKVTEFPLHYGENTEIVTYYTRGNPITAYVYDYNE